MNQPTIQETLEYIIKSDELHARWLNTLSFLEHIGSRKILKTQSSNTTKTEVLRHAAEEARHAYIFKKLIEKTGLQIEDYKRDSMLCGGSANRYFQGLDGMVKKKLKELNIPRAMCYYYVTALIEERAGWLYPIYQECLEKMKSSIDISNIIKEEERHLEEMHTGISGIEESVMEYFRKKESDLFNIYFSKLTKELQLVSKITV